MLFAMLSATVPRKKKEKKTSILKPFFFGGGVGLCYLPLYQAVASAKKGEAQKPPKPNPVSSLVPKPTPMQQCDPSTCDHTLLTYIINFTQNLTIGPLDYCGIACRIKGLGDDV
jgi:hypothetical protein